MIDTAVGPWLLPSSLLASSLASFAFALRLSRSAAAPSERSGARRNSRPERELDVAARVALIERLGADGALDPAGLVEGLRDPCLAVAALAARHLESAYGNEATCAWIGRAVDEQRARELEAYVGGLSSAAAWKQTFAGRR